MSFIGFGTPDLLATAWNDDSTPVAAVVGEFGLVLYSTGREYSDGFQVYTLEKATAVTLSRLNDVCFGSDTFIAVGAGGTIITSEDAQGWTLRTSGVEQNLYGVTHVTGSIFVAVGDQATILRSTDKGLTWTSISSLAGSQLRGVTIGGDYVTAVGENEILISSDLGLTWTVYIPSTSALLYDVVYWGSDFYIVGENSTIIKFSGDGTEEVQTSPVVTTFWGITAAGTEGLLVAVGEDGATATSTDGDAWQAQNSGIPEADFYGIDYGDNRFVTVGKDALVAYSVTGAGRPAFDNFTPISDIYRAQCFCEQFGYMLYGGILAFEEGKWNYYPERIMNAAPATVDDFTSVGWFFADLPGTGPLIDMAPIRGGVVLAHTRQLSLLTDGGSITYPWAHTKNYGEGLRPISNLTSFNGVAYMIADDGLIYTATTNGVARLEGFFDLTRFEDWEPGSESAWLGFDPVYQVLFVFRQKSPWTVWLVNDQTGGVSEIELPEITISNVEYEPRSAFIVNGLHGGIYASYVPTSGSTDEIVNVKLDLDGPITGEDNIAGSSVERFVGDLKTGSFRVTSIGIRGDADEVLIRTWADPDSTTRPDIAVLIREETTDDWMTNDQPHGDITVFTDRVEGVGTAFSRYLDVGESSRVLNVTTPEIELEAIDVTVHHKINVTVPEIELEAQDVIVQRYQEAMKVSVPEIELEPIAVGITHDKPIGLTIPEIQLEAVDVQVTRGGYYKLPWLVDQCRIYREAIDGTRTLATYTKASDYEIVLSSELGTFESLYVNPGAKRPFVLGRVGDYILTEYGWHRISAVNTAYEVELDWYPPAECSGTYVPAQEIPEGGDEGDGKVIVGLGRGFDQMQLRVVILPHDDCDATGAKITKIELGYTPTGKELKTDAGG